MKGQEKSPVIQIEDVIYQPYISVPAAVAEDKRLEQNIKVLNDKSADRYRRLRAAQELGKGKDPRSVPYLIEAVMKDENITVRASAAEALGHTERPEAVKPLIAALLEDPQADVPRDQRL